MLRRIVACGATPADCPAPLRTWLSGLLSRHPEHRLRFYGNHVFIFRSGNDGALVLITILHLPRELLKLWQRTLPAPARPRDYDVSDDDDHRVPRTHALHPA